MKGYIYFDMDGTIADLYGVENWLSYLESGKTKPYREARPLVNMRELGRELRRLQAEGYVIGIISWLSKCGTAEYNERVTRTKEVWLRRHLGSVQFDEIHIVNYGTPKFTLASGEVAYLFDDEERNRNDWRGVAFGADNILETLRAI